MSLIDGELVMVRGGGDLATGCVIRLVRAGFRVAVLETARPSAIRRTVCLSEAIYEGSAEVEAQSRRFVPTASHAISWDEAGQTLLSRVELGVELEVFASPLSLLPRGVVERPGSALLRKIITRNQAGFLAQLEAAFLAWDAAEGVGDAVEAAAEAAAPL